MVSRAAVVTVGLLGCAAFLAAQPQFSSTPVASYWLRIYPIANYGEIWRLSLSVKDFDKGLAKVQATLEKGGAKSVLPTEIMAGSTKNRFQQLSYTMSAGAAPKLLAQLQKLGDVEEIQKNPGAHPGVMEEVPGKFAKLKAEVGDKAEKLAQYPNAQTAIAEILAHLELVEKGTREASSKVLLNLNVRQQPAKN